MIDRTERERALVDGFRAIAAKMIGQWNGYGIVGHDNTFRGPGVSIFTISARTHGNEVLLRIRRRDPLWYREIRIAPNNSWRESTNAGPVEHSSADFPSEQKAIIRRLFDDIRRASG